MEIFGNEIEYSDTMKKICLEYKKHCHENVIVDLRPRAPFFKQLSHQVTQDYNQEIEQRLGNLIPDDVHDLLVNFFSQELSDAEWQNKIDDLRPENDSKLMVATTRIIRRTLPQL